jgi:Transglycosylase SLT domain/Family of unknown function (DUF5715)
MAVRRRRALLALLLAAVAVSAVLLFVLRQPGTRAPRLEPFGPAEGAAYDPLAYVPGRRDDFERRAAAGLAHPLYAMSPGGVEATARRVARYRPLVEATAAQQHLDPDMLEALIFLESAGRPDAQASSDLHAAAGLTQILAETGTDLLGMRIDVARSARLTRGIARGHRLRARKRERRRVDERFDPPKAIAASGRYLAFARGKLGRDDLAFESYHMGVGNLQAALGAYGQTEIPYAQLFFDSSPRHHPQAWRRLAALGDDSATYLWRLLAARDIMRLYRQNVLALGARAAGQLAKNSAEEVLHPAATTEVFADPFALGRAQAAHRLVRLDPKGLAAAGIRLDPQMGALARRVHQSPRLYRALRPEALRILLYLGTATKQLSGTEPLVLTSTVRDEQYQRVLERANVEATRRYSLHTTGFAFDIARAYRTRAQAQAFQFALDRLTALNEIAWVREAGAIHVTVTG